MCGIHPADKKDRLPIKNLDDNRYGADYYLRVVDWILKNPYNLVTCVKVKNSVNVTVFK